MTMQSEHVDHAIPDILAFVLQVHGHVMSQRRLALVLALDGVLQLGGVRGIHGSPCCGRESAFDDIQKSAGGRPSGRQLLMIDLTRYVSDVLSFSIEHLSNLRGAILA